MTSEIGRERNAKAGKAREKAEVPQYEMDPVGSARRTRRRALLGAISAAGFTGTAPLPRHWAHPVVDHVLLPAHAQVSPLGCTVLCTETVELTIVTTELTVNFFEVSVTQAVTFACQREPDDDVASASASISTSSTTSETNSLPTVTSASESAASSFSEGVECEIDLSDLLELP